MGGAAGVDAAGLAAGAAAVLRANHTGVMTKAAPDLYPHQWSWDAAFNAIGWASLDVVTAAAELEALFAGQWGNGMVPHIVFEPARDGYFPGAEVWEVASAASHGPAGVLTSGICQPPVHALSAMVVYASGDAQRATRANTRRWLQRLYPKLIAWHRYLVRDRLDERTGLLAIVHGWESGTDNSPRWDRPYACVPASSLRGQVRRDTSHVADPGQRPSDRDYSRYIQLLEEAKSYGYDASAVRARGSFVVGDVLSTAILALASDALAHLGDVLGGGESGEMRACAQDARSAVLAQVDPRSGLAADIDLRTGEALGTETIAGFAPLIAGRLPRDLRRQLTDELLGPRWAGHPALRWRVPPSTSPECDSFDPRNYWRGPVWPVISWLLSWCLAREGEGAAADSIMRDSLQQLAGGHFAEYYQPFTGEPLGSHRQSWTAAVALDWLVSGTRTPVRSSGQHPESRDAANESRHPQRPSARARPSS